MAIGNPVTAHAYSVTSYKKILGFCVPACPLPAKFIVPEWGNKFDSGIPEPMEPGGPVRQHYAGVNFISHSGTVNFATGLRVEGNLELNFYTKDLRKLTNCLMLCLYC
jgi:hypothetical protein